MTKNMIVGSLVAVALVASAGAALAAPEFTVGTPGSGMKISDFASQLAVFNKAEITDFVGAKTVTVQNYDTAWARGGAMEKSVELLSDDAQSIHLLREGLKANPAAVKLLAEHKIGIDNVVDIVSDGKGNVSLYIS